VGWVFRRGAGAALLVSPDAPSTELEQMKPRPLTKMTANAFAINPAALSR